MAEIAAVESAVTALRASIMSDAKNKKMKNLLYELGVVEELVINRASVAEIRPHTIALRGEAEKVAKKLKALLRIKAAHSLLEEAHSHLHNEYIKLKQAHLKLREQHAKPKASRQQAQMKDKGGFFNPLGV